MAFRSRKLCPPRIADHTSPDYNSEDFQSELLPLHSPLLRESWLVSFPPPSYMLKFSGYSCLIGGPKRKISLALRHRETRLRSINTTTSRPPSVNRQFEGTIFGGCYLLGAHSVQTDRLRPATTTHRLSGERWGCGGDKQTLQQAYSPREVQAAFKVLMTHWILQFALRIAFRCVLHRYGSQDIRC